MDEQLSLFDLPKRAPVTEKLDQGKVWQTADGRTLLLEEMTPRHRRNLLAWLERNATGLKFHYELAFALSGSGPNGEAAQDAFDDAVDGLMRQSDEEWLEDLPLVQRLRELEQLYDHAVVGPLIQIMDRAKNKRYRPVPKDETAGTWKDER